MIAYYSGFDFDIFVEMLPIQDYKLESNSFNYEYGSQTGTHICKPSIIDNKWRIVKYDPEMLMFHSLEHVSNVINNNDNFLKIYEDTLIDEYVREMR